MYAGTTFNKKSGRMAGVHQRIDRVARRSLRPYIQDGQYFPTIRTILHFEGKNGPDGIKRKSPGVDEPWHFIDPHNPNDTGLIAMINDHIFNLAAALRDKNDERAGFEAAWLAHAVTDGLTPAHHYPLEEKLAELRDGQGLETRNTTLAKIVLPGQTRRHQIKNNWEMWGKGGVMTSHLGFELGVMTSLRSHRIMSVKLNDTLLRIIDENDYEAGFRTILKRVADMNMYETYLDKAWTRKLAHEARGVLIPAIVEAVTLAWREALKQSKEAA